MCGLSVRVFRDGDEQIIVNLFNEVYSRYGGFVPRTAEYWRWCCLQRPDVEKNGVFLTFEGDKFQGYVVAGLSGNIWEFCVIDDDKQVTRALLNEAVNYLEKAGVSSIDINVPRGSNVAECLREADFSKLPAARMFVTSLDPAALVQALANPWKESLLKRIQGDFGIRLNNASYGVCNEFSVKIHDPSVEVVEGFPARPSAVVELEFMDFLSILLGRSSARRLLITRKLKVKPLRKLGAALTFLSTVRLRNSWYFPLSDYV